MVPVTVSAPVAVSASVSVVVPVAVPVSTPVADIAFSASVAVPVTVTVTVSVSAPVAVSATDHESWGVSRANFLELAAAASVPSLHAANESVAGYLISAIRLSVKPIFTTADGTIFSKNVVFNANSHL